MKRIYLILLVLFSMQTFAQIDEQSFTDISEFGNSVAIDGQWAVVGHQYASGERLGITYPNAGLVSIYKKLTTGNWVHFQNLQEPVYYANPAWPNSQMGQLYGCSVDISDRTIVVGASFYDSDLQSDIGPDGMAFVYEYDPFAQSFVRVAIFAPELEVANKFGSSVAISGDWIAVGDPSEQHPIPGGNPNEDVQDIGCVHVYQRVNFEWEHHSKIIASDGWGSQAFFNGDDFGYSVDIEDEVVLVGAPEKGVENGVKLGAVYLYELNGGIWNETIFDGMMMMVDEHARFGHDVSLKDDYFVVGAPSSASAAQGSVFLYHHVGGVWSAEGPITSSDSQNGNRFGYSVSLNSNTMAVGAYGFDSEGKCYFYDYTETMTESDLQSSDITTGDGFGTVVNLSEDGLVISAIRGLGFYQDGTVYLYSLAQGFDGGWIGGIDNDWGNPDNWADFNVPNGNTDVVIGAGAPNKPYVNNLRAFCRNLTLEAGALLDVNGSNALTINGNFNNAGQVGVGDKSESSDPFITVLGETVFNGEGQQDIPPGIYQDFTFDAGLDSYLLGDITINGDYYHNSNKKLYVGNNEITFGSLIYDNGYRLKFNETSSIRVINDRIIDLTLPENLWDLYDLTIDVSGNHSVILDGDLSIHHELSLINGDLIMGHGPGCSMSLYNPIIIGNGQLKPNSNGQPFSMFILNSEEDNKSEEDFNIPSGLTRINILFIERSGNILLNGDLNIESNLQLNTSGFDANGFQITYEDGARLGIGGDAEITEDMMSGPNGVQDISISSGSPVLDFSGEIPGDLTIGAGTEQVEIAAGRCITVSGTTAINSGLILRSDANGTACFIDNGPVVYGAKSNSGITVERYIPSKDHWHYVASPIQNATAQFFAGAYLNWYDTENSAWVAFTSLDQALNTMQGYASKLPGNYSGQTISFEGELNSARINPISIDLTNSGDAYNLVGNPFPSVIDWDNANWTKNNVANAIYTWNAGTGAYATYVAGAATNGGSRYIAPMQGFFVEATGANPSLQIDNNSVRLDQAATFLKDEEVIKDQLSIVLTSTEGQDEIIVRFLEKATALFDIEYDAHKMFGNNSLAQVYAIDDSNEEMAIHTLNNTKETDVVKLGLKINESGTYSMNFNNHESFTGYVTITLEDKKTGAFIVLANEDSYEFSFEVGEEQDRFVLHFKDVTGIDNLQEQESFVYIINNRLYINMDADEDVDLIQVYSVNGQLIKKLSSQNDPIIGVQLDGLSRGTYIVKVTTESSILTQKFIY